MPYHLAFFFFALLPPAPLLLPGKLSLSVSHRDKGPNFGRSNGPVAELVRQLGEEDGSLKWWRASLPATSDLLWYDMCFHQLKQRPISRTVAEFRSLAWGIKRVRHWFSGLESKPKTRKPEP